jgi:phosphoribosyl 1,2-cyclic phosphodiesterase
MPATGAEFAGVGGNTSCVAVAHDGQPPSLVIDAGTGLRRLADALDGEPFRGTILLSHLHWDHVMGLPFFRAGDRPDSRVDLRLPEQGVEPVELLSRVMAPPFFPITSEGLRGDWAISTYDEGSFQVEGFEVTVREIPHKGSRTLGLRVSDGTASLAYLSDHSPQSLGDGEDGMGALHPAAMELADSVDVLVHGAQFSLEEYPQRKGFGHAVADYAVGLGVACGVGTVVLFHHDPWRDDAAVAALRDEVARPAGPEVVAAVEGTVIAVGPSAP